jgi:hypothetical protein
MRTVYVSTGHGVYRFMNITVKIHDVRRKYGGITEPGARSALLTHAHRCNTSLDTMLVSAHACSYIAMLILRLNYLPMVSFILNDMNSLQAAYNNTSEVELDMDSTEGGASTTSELCQFPVGTKVAKKFDDEWYEGVVRRYDADDDLYWVLYTDGDSEDMDCDEAQQAVQDYKQHMQTDEAMSETSTESAPASPPAVLPSAPADMSDTSTESAPAVPPAVIPSASVAPSSVVAETTIVLNSAATSFVLPPEMRAALQALTAAAERLGTVADAAQSTAMTTAQLQQQESWQQQCMRMWQQQQHMYCMRQQHHRIMWRQQLMLQQQQPYMLQQQWPQQQQQQQQQLWRRPFI